MDASNPAKQELKGIFEISPDDRQLKFAFASRGRPSDLNDPKDHDSVVLFAERVNLNEMSDEMLFTNERENYNKLAPAPHINSFVPLCETGITAHTKPLRHEVLVRIA